MDEAFLGGIGGACLWVEFDETETVIATILATTSDGAASNIAAWGWTNDDDVAGGGIIFPVGTETGVPIDGASVAGASASTATNAAFVAGFGNNDLG